LIPGRKARRFDMLWVIRYYDGGYVTVDEHGEFGKVERIEQAKKWLSRSRVIDAYNTFDPKMKKGRVGIYIPPLSARVER
jgi:hypothetical protein